MFNICPSCAPPARAGRLRPDNAGAPSAVTPTTAATTVAPTAAATVTSTPDECHQRRTDGRQQHDTGSGSTVTTEPAPAQAAAAAFVDTGKWIEGKHYFLIDPPQPTSHPGKIEVTEVFSYVCPACNQFHTTVDRIARTCPLAR